MRSLRSGGAMWTSSISGGSPMDTDKRIKGSSLRPVEPYTGPELRRWQREKGRERARRVKQAQQSMKSTKAPVLDW